MNAELKNQKIPLSTEDRSRMARLFEEVEGRLHEMSRIVTRTTKMETSQS